MESGPKKNYSREKKEKDLFHVIHKVPSGDGPYVRAKHAQLVEKDPEAAIIWFWKAINAGDRVDSALKDMAVVMKQLDRSEEAIEAINSFRGLCPRNAQESLDNVLIDLYKGNLAWAYMQKSNFAAAEAVYSKAQMIDPDANKALNLCHCLIKQARYNDARLVLQDVLRYELPGSDDLKSRNRAEELWLELDLQPSNSPLLSSFSGLSFEDDFVEALERVMNEWAPARTRRLPIFEEISQLRDQLAC
ncbi:protein sulfur deficiency-induced 1 [Phtheirospermum japonicum]|uniref:Protein sulfur deficiency-induced 1 n=1 Tax=Phtheirospermum japonicum TaxID=374723 RepID=A0A830BGI5_9LAMI|nr:protein sulfur deficiency-induced 1 [Phtheirospermum japonicum]